MIKGRGRSSQNAPGTPPQPPAGIPVGRGRNPLAAQVGQPRGIQGEAQPSHVPIQQMGAMNLQERSRQQPIQQQQQISTRPRTNGNFYIKL